MGWLIKVKENRIEEKRRLRKQKQREKNKQLLKYLAVIILAAAVIVYIFNLFFFSIVTVEGDSMQRTLFDGDKILVRKIGVDGSDFNRDDLIYFTGANNRYYVKRVIGLPGDAVEIVNDKVLINGIEKIEEYTRGDATESYDINKWILSENEYFVLGDNRYRTSSRDSRIFGPIEEENIVGKVIKTFTKER